MNDLDDTYLPAVPDDDGRSVVPYAPGPAPFLPDASGNEPAVDLLADISAPPPAQQQQARELIRAISEFGTAFRQAGVPEAQLAAVGTWLDAVAPKLQGQPDAVFIASFRSHMQRAGAAPRTIAQMIAYEQRWEAQQAGAAAFTDTELDDISDEEIARQQSACLAELERRWQHELPGKLAVVRTHMKRLPGHLRDHLELSLLPGNLLSGNSPDVVEMVYRDACGLESAPSAKGLAQAIDAIEHTLRIDRKRYNRDPTMQARYRELLRLRDG